MAKVQLSKLKECKAFIKEINRLSFNEIQWILEDNEIQPISEELKELKLIFDTVGLCNTDFGMWLLEEHLTTASTGQQ